MIENEQNLSYKILVYIAYCLKDNRYKLSYDLMQKVFLKIYKENYEISTLRKEYSLLKSRGFLELKKRYRKMVPFLTPKGKLYIKTQLPYKKYDAWDEKWRMVIFDIPEDHKKFRWDLRYKLISLGFAKLQRSAYISPYPLLNIVNRYAANVGIKKYIKTMELIKVDLDKKLIDEIWNITNINNQYIQFVKFAKIQKDAEFWPLQAKILEQEFIKIYIADPQLPQEFLPADWAGTNAYNKFKELVNSY